MDLSYVNGLALYFSIQHHLIEHTKETMVWRAQKKQKGECEREEEEEEQVE